MRLRGCAQALAAAAPPGERAELPRDVGALEALPGLGPYTARAVLVFAHNADLAAVDANVRRVLIHELGLPPDIGRAGLQAVAERCSRAAGPRLAQRAHGLRRRRADRARHRHRAR